MANNTRCTYQTQWALFVNLVIFSAMAVVALFVSGGIIFRRDHHAKMTHEQHTCEVLASSYYESRCSGGRGSSYVCYRPVWIVTYNILEDDREISINARIEEGGFRWASAAQNRLDEFQIGSSHTCWCSVVDPSKARWDEPNTFDGMMLLIFGGVHTLICFVGIFFSWRVRKRM